MLKKFDRTHQAILKVGMDLLRSCDFDEIGILDICKAAGISRPSFYIHFRSKEQLLAEYFESTVFITEELLEWIESYDNPFDRLIRLWLSYITHLHLVSNVQLFSHYFSYRVLNGNDSTSEALNRSLKTIMLPYIKDAQRMNLIGNKSDPMYLCNSIMLLHNGTLYEWCLSDGQIDHFKQFFWNMESVLQVSEDCRGLWKMEEHIPNERLLMNDFIQDDET